MAKFFLHDIEIGRRLIDLRGDKSAREIAMGAGIDPSQYGKIEKGKLSMTENILEKLTNKYKWDEDYILWGNRTNVPRETSNEDQLSDTALRLLKLLEKQTETVNSQQEVIHSYRMESINDPPKNGLPSLKTGKPVK